MDRVIVKQADKATKKPSAAVFHKYEEYLRDQSWEFHLIEGKTFSNKKVSFTVIVQNKNLVKSSQGLDLSRHFCIKAVLYLNCLKQVFI